MHRVGRPETNSPPEILPSRTNCPTSSSPPTAATSRHELYTTTSPPTTTNAATACATNAVHAAPHASPNSASVTDGTFCRAAAGTPEHSRSSRSSSHPSTDNLCFNTSSAYASSRAGTATFSHSLHPAHSGAGTRVYGRAPTSTPTTRNE